METNNKEKKYTPMMQQYLEVKSKLLDAIVFYRLGDFYEMFFEDAKTASTELDLVLTGRNAGVEEKVPMCGIPYHAASSYITRLTQKGYKVAIVEQLEDPQAGKIVKRDVIKIVTPGTIMEESYDEKETNYIVSINDYGYGLAIVFCEMTCGELKAKCIDSTSVELQKTLLSMNVREVVVEKTLDIKYQKLIKDIGFITLSFEENKEIKSNYKKLVKNIEDHRILDSFGLLINYLEYTQKQALNHLGNLEIIQDDKYLQMDYSTKTNLELINPIRSNSKSETLWSFIDYAKSAMGSRMLKNFVEYPLIEESKINDRLDTIEYLNFNFLLKDELKEYLSNVYDMERLCAKIAYGNANPRDLLRLISSLKYAPMIIDIFKDCDAMNEYRKVDSCAKLYEKIEGVFVENPPINYKDGDIFVDGYNEELDKCRILKNSGKNFILELEAKEKERTGINSLKIGYNRIFGYYIEVRKANTDKILDEYGYVRKQTLANAERYVTEELKSKEDAILHAEERSKQIERELYITLINDIKVYLPRLHELANALAYIDAMYALSVVSSEFGYIRPIFNHDMIVELKDARHPILDKMMKEKKYVANDLMMNSNDQIYIITGPNMGGKSTYMRQVALSVILAQIGCFVPASYANLPVFDKIFTRIGASDDIMSGQSTFMVEMIEANYALKNATDNSLILFDEIGRGTSTYDGMSLAHAMIEYISKTCKAKTLFSTHYHELTALGDNNENIKNIHVEVHEENNDVTFLYKIKSGKANKSYGINVARLAKLPDSVINRAKYLLNHIKSSEANFENIEEETPVIAEINPKEKDVIDLLEKVNVDDISAKDALMLIYDLKDKLK